MRVKKEKLIEVREVVKSKVLVLGAALTALASACGGGNSARKPAETTPVDMHTAEIALDYQGFYKGVIPAADCPGIEVSLTLKENGTYDLHYKYLERDSEFDASGVYAVERDLLTLESSNPTYFKIEENRLRCLDAEKKPIEGELADHYILQKSLQ